MKLFDTLHNIAKRVNTLKMYSRYIKYGDNIFAVPDVPKHISSYKTIASVVKYMYSSVYFKYDNIKYDFYPGCIAEGNTVLYACITIGDKTVFIINPCILINSNPVYNYIKNKIYKCHFKFTPILIDSVTIQHKEVIYVDSDKINESLLDIFNKYEQENSGD